MMQTIISEIASTFVDDAAALANGFATVTREIAIETYAAIRARIVAPVDRLARACDVGNVISCREAAMTRSRVHVPTWRRAPAPRRLRHRFNIFRGLYDLT